MEAESDPQTLLIEKVDKALALRLEGNEKFRAGDLQEAMRIYHNVLLQLKGLNCSIQTLFDPPPPPKVPERYTRSAMQDKIKQAIGLSYLNMAAIHLKKLNYKRALECSLESVKADPKNSKAKFREAQARIGLGQLTTGRKMQQELQKASPDIGIANALTQLEADEKRRNEIQNSAFKGIFNRPTVEKAKVAE